MSNGLMHAWMPTLASPWIRLAFMAALPLGATGMLRFGLRSAVVPSRFDTYAAAMATAIPGVVFVVTGILIAPLRWMHGSAWLTFVPYAFIGIALVYGLVRLWWARRAARRIVMGCRAPTGRLAEAARDCGIEARELPVDWPVCMLVGMRRPVAIVSTAAIGVCGADELRAALLHERAHARSGDTVVATVVDFLADLAPFAPTDAFRDAYRRMREFAADAEAARAVSPESLASALLALARRTPTTRVGIAFADNGTLASRLAVLLGQAERRVEREGVVLRRALAGVSLAAGCALAATPLAYSAGLHAAMPTDPALLVHHTVSTTNALAQQRFDAGLSHIYSYSYGAARRAFGEAIEADPHLAMAYWGIALSDGPNVNMPSDSANEADALAELDKARALGMSSTPAERALIEALGARYSTASHADYRALERAYSAAMRRVADAYPNDLDVRTLYGESLLNTMDPHEIYGPVDTSMARDVIAVFDEVLRRDPSHVGARHYQIHAVEDVDPSAGITSADFLQALTLAPEDSHLAHMPSHIYMRVGRFEDAIRANHRAIELAASAPHDESMRHMHMPGMDPRIMSGGPPMHVLLNLLYGLFTLGREKEASVAVAHAQPQAAITVDVRFGEWTTVYATPSDRISAARYRLAHGLAAAALGKTDEARAAMAAAGDTISALLIQAAIARHEQRTNDEIAALQHATRLRDVGTEGEPPELFFYPVGEHLGGALLRARRYAEAETVFRSELARFPKDPRDLFGLSLALLGQAKDASVPAAEARAAWAKADTPLTVDGL